MIGFERGSSGNRSNRTVAVGDVACSCREQYGNIIYMSLPGTVANLINI